MFSSANTANVPAPLSAPTPPTTPSFLAWTPALLPGGSRPPPLRPTPHPSFTQKASWAPLGSKLLWVTRFPASCAALRSQLQFIFCGRLPGPPWRGPVPVGHTLVAPGTSCLCGPPMSISIAHPPVMAESRTNNYLADRRMTEIIVTSEGSLSSSCQGRGSRLPRPSRL